MRAPFQMRAPRPPGLPGRRASLAGETDGGQDPETTDWVNRVTANSGSASAATIALQDIFLKGLKTQGLRSKVLRWQSFCGDAFGNSNVSGNLGAVQVPLIKDKGGALDVSDTFQINWVYQETGAGGGLKRRAGDGSGHLLTGFVCANDFAADDNAGFCVYVGTAVNEATWCCGVQDASGNDMGLVGPDYTALGTRPDLWKPGSITADAGGKGFYHVTKIAGGNIRTYKNGVLFSSQPNPGGSRVLTYEFAIFGLNIAGLVQAKTTKTLCAVGLVAAMNDTEAANLYTLVQAQQTGFSRNV